MCLAIRANLLRGHGHRAPSASCRHPDVHPDPFMGILCLLPTPLPTKQINRTKPGLRPTRFIDPDSPVGAPIRAK